MLRYLIFITIGILLYLLLNRYNTFSIGVPHHIGGSSGPGRMATRSPRLGGGRECAGGGDSKYFIRVPVYKSKIGTNSLPAPTYFYIETAYDSVSSAEEDIRRKLLQYKEEHLYFLNSILGRDTFSVQTYLVVDNLPNLNIDTLFESFPIVFDCLQAVLCRQYGGDIQKLNFGRINISIDGRDFVNIYKNFNDLDDYFCKVIYEYWISFQRHLIVVSTQQELDLELPDSDIKMFTQLERLPDATYDCSKTSCCIMR
jgi:hypothetical protein